jgi:hypothetical protein
MAEYAGSALYLGWSYSGGTIALAANFRTFSWAPTMNFIDATAGADTYENLLTSYGTGGEFSVETLAQTAGTALAAALDRQTKGTVIFGPEGNTAGKLRYLIPSYSTGPQWNTPFNDVSTLTANWRQYAAETRGTFS